MPEAIKCCEIKVGKIHINMKKTDHLLVFIVRQKFAQLISLHDSGIGKMCMPDTGKQEKQDKPQKPPKLYNFYSLVRRWMFSL